VSGGSGDAIWITDDIYFGSDFYILGTDLKVYDSLGNLRGHGSRTGLNILCQAANTSSCVLYLSTNAPMNYSGNPINSKVVFEFTARRLNNQPVTSNQQPLTSGALTTAAVTSKPVTSNAVTSASLTSKGLTTSRVAATTGAQPATTAAASASCTVGATRCLAQTTYQTCVYTYGTGGWIGGWGSSQSCATGTSCVQYGTSPNTYIGCN